MILLWLIIALNILICYVYASNKVFPLFFMMAEIIYALSIIAEDELMIILLLVFSVLYNFFMIIEQKHKRFDKNE